MLPISRPTKMYSYLVFALLMLAALMAASARAESQTRQYINFNDGWKFTLGDNDIYKKTTFNDSGWTTVEVPHDYIYEEGVSEVGSQGQSGGYHGGGTAWYRKHFAFDNAWKLSLIHI